MLSLNFNDGRSESLSEILEINPHFKATDLAWSIARRQLKERLTTEAMACLGELLGGFGSIPVDTIPHADMLPLLIAQGLAEDCTAETQRARMKKLFSATDANETPSVPQR